MPTINSATTFSVSEKAEIAKALGKGGVAATDAEMRARIDRWLKDAYLRYELAKTDQSEDAGRAIVEAAFA